MPQVVKQAEMIDGIRWIGCCGEYSVKAPGVGVERGIRWWWIRVFLGDEKTTVAGEQVVVLRIAIRHRYLPMIER